MSAVSVLSKGVGQTLVALNTMSVRDAARRYVALGYSPTPLHPLGKKPKLAGWPDLVITSEEVDARFGEIDNIGLLLRDGIVDIDLDSPQALKLADGLLPPCACIFGRDSRPASHRLYRSQKDLKTQMFAAGDITHVEIRAGGNQTRVPPSRDEDGTQVQFEQGASFPSYIAGAELARRTVDLATACVLLEIWPVQEGNRHHVALAAAGWLLRRGLQEDRVESIIVSVARAAGDKEIEDRAKAVRSTAANIEKGIGVVGLPQLVDLTGAAASLNHANKWLVADSEPNAQKSVRPPLSTLALSAPAFLKQFIPPREELVSPWLHRGSLNLVYSPPKVGKTWFILQLAASLAAGLDLLNWGVPKPRNVLYLDGEMGISDLMSRLETLKITLSDRLQILPSERAAIEGDRINIMSPDDQSWIIEHVDAVPELDVLILDNLGSLAQGWDENDNSSPELDRFKSWLLTLRERGVAVFLVHHCGHEGRHPRGASGLSAIMNTVIRLSRDGDDGKCAFTIAFEHVRGCPPTPDKFAVRLQSVGDKMELVVGGAKISSAQMRVLKALCSGTCTTQKSLAEKVSLSTAAVSTSMKALIERGLVVRKKPMPVPTKEGLKVVESSELKAKGLFTQHD